MYILGDSTAVVITYVRFVRRFSMKLNLALYSIFPFDLYSSSESDLLISLSPPSIIVSIWL